MSAPVIGDPRPAGQSGPAGDQRAAGEAGAAGDPRRAGVEHPTAAAEGYDPADHTVADVLAHLATVDPDERDRIIAAEQDGKARVTILNYSA